MSARPATVARMRLLTIVGPRGARWHVERPTTRRDRRRGLRGRTLDASRGMLFERCRSVQTLAMHVPIAVAFLDASWRVVRVERAAPGRILACPGARRVLECHIGADLRVGDVLGRRYTLAAAPLSAVKQLGEPPSSSGLGHRPFKAAARVRIPLGARTTTEYAGVEESGRPHRTVKAKIAGSKPVTRARSTGPGSSVGRARG